MCVAEARRRKSVFFILGLFKSTSKKERVMGGGIVMYYIYFVLPEERFYARNLAEFHLLCFLFNDISIIYKLYGLPT